MIPRPLSEGLRVEEDDAMAEALQALRDGALEPEPESAARLETLVLRRRRVENDLRDWRWWTPVAAAALAVFLLALALVGPWAPASDTADSTRWPAYTDSSR